jgi:hypothetical protein
VGRKSIITQSLGPRNKCPSYKNLSVFATKKGSIMNNLESKHSPRALTACFAVWFFIGAIIPHLVFFGCSSPGSGKGPDRTPVNPETPEEPPELPTEPEPPQPVGEFIFELDSLLEARMSDYSATENHPEHIIASRGLYWLVPTTTAVSSINALESQIRTYEAGMHKELRDRGINSWSVTNYFTLIYHNLGELDEFIRLLRLDQGDLEADLMGATWSQLKLLDIMLEDRSE